MPAFYNNTAIRTVIDKVLVIPYMPAEDIQTTFNSIRLESDAELASLFDYIDSTWITSYQWRPSTWSVFRVEIRTNNDAEGQHTLWNKGKGKQPFYAFTEYFFSLQKNLKSKQSCLPMDYSSVINENRQLRRTNCCFVFGMILFLM